MTVLQVEYSVYQVEYTGMMNIHNKITIESGFNQIDKGKREIQTYSIDTICCLANKCNIVRMDISVYKRRALESDDVRSFFKLERRLAIEAHFRYNSNSLIFFVHLSTIQIIFGKVT